MATPNMSMDLPVVSTTIGPDWAAKIITAMAQILDTHDHSSGKGVKVGVGGMNIAADLGFNGARPINLGGLKFQSASLAGAGAEAGQMLMSGNDFYLVDGAGNQFQLTSGGLLVLTGRNPTSVVGNPGGSFGAAQDIVAARDNVSLQRLSSTSLAFAPLMTLPPAKTVATSNIALSGTQTVNGVALGVGDPCLVTQQTTGSQNGLYTVASGAWTRHTAAAVTGQLVPGQMIYVTGGYFAGTILMLANTSNPVIGTDTPTWIVPGKAWSRGARYATIAASLLGPSIDWDFEDFTFGFSRWINGNAGGGTNVLTDVSEPTARGMVVNSTAASAGSAAVLQNAGQASDINVNSQGWYIAHRSKISTSVTAAVQAFAGIVDVNNANTLLSGFCGPLNASNFGAQYNGSFLAGSFLNSGVPVDTNWHVHEMWATGSTLNYRIDGANLVNAAFTLASYPGASRSILRVLDSVGAAVRTMKTDWYMTAQVAS